MHHRVTIFAAATAIGALGQAHPTSATQPTEDAGAEAQTGSGHPEALAALTNGDAIAIGDGGWITRRPGGATTWEPARRELPVSDGATVDARDVISSGNTLLAVFRDYGVSVAFVWRPHRGWTDPVAATGPIWEGPHGTVGVGSQRYRPARGWATLPAPPLDPIQMGADADGRISAVGIAGGELRIARLEPSEGWAPSIRVTDIDDGDTVDLAVSQSGGRAMTVSRAHRLVLFRRLGEDDWRHYIVTDAKAPDQGVHLDDEGRATVVWRDDEGRLTTSRLDADDEWTLAQRLTGPTSSIEHGFVLRGTADGQLAIAYRRADDGWTTYARVRTPEGLWSEPYQAASVGDEYGLAMSPASCATAYAWTERIGTFATRTLGSCADPDPAPVDPDTDWPPLATPYAALTYEGDRIHVVRTDDGHTLLGWTGLQARQARVTELFLTGYATSEQLGPPGETCHLRRLDAFGSVAQAILDCGYRQWYARSWTAETGWAPPTRMPTDDGEADFEVNASGGTVGMFAFNDERQARRVLYRPTVDADWQELPRPPAFGDLRVDWAVTLTDDGVVVLVDGDGSEYATWEPATGIWSPVLEAPIAATEWRIADDGTLLAWQKPDAFAVGHTDGRPWGDPQFLDYTDSRQLELVPDQVVVVDVEDVSDEPVTRDFYIPTQTWSEPTVLGIAGSPSHEPKLAVNAAGDAVVTWAQTDRFGFAAPDLVWRREAGSSIWSAPELVPDGYDIAMTVLPDGTLAATTDNRVDAAGVWLSLRDAD